MNDGYPNLHSREFNSQSHTIPVTRPTVNPRSLLALPFSAPFCDVKSEPLPSDGAAIAVLDVLVLAADNVPRDIAAVLNGSKVVSTNVADNANDVVLVGVTGVKLPVELTVIELAVEGLTVIVVVPSMISGTSTTVTCPAPFVSFTLIVRVVIDAIAVGDDPPRPLPVSVAELESVA